MKIFFLKIWPRACFKVFRFSHFELQQKTLAAKELPKFPRVHWFVFHQIAHGKWLNSELFRNLTSCIPTKGGFKNWLVGTKESYKTSTKERYRRLFGANILINLLYTSVWTKLPLFICAYISSLIYSNHYFTFSQRSYFNSLRKGLFFKRFLYFYDSIGKLQFLLTYRLFSYCMLQR